MHPAALSIDHLLEDCQQKNTRRGGPGGQHRNKTDSAVVITHASGIVGQAGESRSQDTNRKNAIHRLRLKLAIELRFTPNEKLSSTWVQRCVLESIEISAAHVDFPAILAEALDHFADTEFDLAKTASDLQITSSQILKLLRKHPPALQNCNREREKIGLHPLA